MFDQVNAAWGHLSYEETPDLVPAFPTTPLSYKDMEDLISLRDTVAGAVIAKGTGKPAQLCHAILAKSAEYWQTIADSWAAGYSKPFEYTDRYRKGITFLNQFLPTRTASHPVADVSADLGAATCNERRG